MNRATGENQMDPSGRGSASRRPARLAALAMLLLVGAGTETATAQTTCPSFSRPAGHTQVWTGTVTVEEALFSTVPVGHGFVTTDAIASPDAGDLSVKTFDFDSTSYTITDLYVRNERLGGTAGELNFRLSSAVPEAQRHQLQLHVCGESFALADAQLNAGSRYSWPTAGLDWSSEISRVVYLTDAPVPPVFDPEPAPYLGHFMENRRSLTENTGGGIDIEPNRRRPVTATDPDGGTITYSLEGPDGANFAINSATGQLRTKYGVTYDYETTPIMRITVRATDPDGLYATRDIEVHLRNVVETRVVNVRVQAPGGTSDRLLVTWDAPERSPNDVNQYEIWYIGGTGAKGRNAVWRCVERIDDPTVITRPRVGTPGSGTATTPNASEACFDDEMVTLPNLEANTEYRVQIRARYRYGVTQYGHPAGPWTTMRARTGSGPSSAPSEPLTAMFQEAPTRHTGEAFVIELAFSEAFPVTEEEIRAGLSATGATVTTVAQAVAGENQVWTITLTPSSAADDVSVTLTPKEDCETESAICTADRRGLAEPITTEVPGREPTGVTSVSVTSEPGTNGTWDTGETVTAEVVFSRQVGVQGPPGVGPTLGIMLGGARREAAWTGGSGTDTLTFSHTVGADDNGATSAGIITNGITTNGVIIGDTEGYEAILTFTGAEDTAQVEEPQEDPLTVQFENVPASHDGDDDVVFEIRFSKNPSPYGYATLRDHTLRVSQGGTRVVPRRAKRMQSGSNERWRITVEPTSKEDMSISIEPTTDCSDTGAVCTADTPPQMLSVGASRVIGGPPSLSVADARAAEGNDATIDFTISLNRAASETVSVEYTTSDGTATAGADYVAVTDTASIAAGETSTTVSVQIIDDAIDEGEETFSLTLSNASGGDVWIADATATGTIENEDHMPSAWLSRFGRTVASQAVDAIGGRMQGDGTSNVTIAGHSFSRTGDEPEREDDAVRVLDPLAPDEAPGTMHMMSAQEVLLGSSFQLTSGGGAGSAAWTAWGEVAMGGFDAEVGDTRLEGSVTSGFLGADVGNGRWLAGLALSLSEGEGDYALVDNGRGGQVESSLTTVYPYARLSLSNSLDVWTVIGLGQGDLTLTHMPESGPAQVYRPDIDMRMGAIGSRGEVWSPTTPGGLSVAIKSDAFWVRTSSEAVRTDDGNLEAAETDVTRFRLTAEGSKTYDTGGGKLTPTVTIGARQDGGDAETGTGIEAGVGIRYAGHRVTIDGNVRTLLAHEESGYEEWGASGSIQINPNASGRGLALSLTPSWGTTGGGTEQLWSLRDTSVLARGNEFESEAGSRLEAEVGYGLGLRHAHGVVTPFAAMTFGDGRNVRTGARWQWSRNAAFGLEARRDTGYGNTPETGVRLEARMRF